MRGVSGVLQVQTCTICHVRIKGSQYHLKRHIADFHHKSSKPFKCSICGGSFTLKHNLRWHQRHNKQCLLAALKSGSVGTSRSELCAEKEHHGVVSKHKRYCCSSCGKSYAFFTSLQRHQRRREQCWVATRRNTYRCSTCGESFHSIIGLKVHEGSKHSILPASQTPMSEPASSEESKHAEDKKQHYKVVSKHKPHYCSRCGLSFVNRMGLMIHKGRIHPRLPAERAPSLRLADTSGPNYTENKKQPVEVISKHKPYGCPVCGLTFKNRMGLKIHQGRRHHKMPARPVFKAESLSGSTASSKDAIVEKQHHKVVSKHKPHCCSRCGLSFATRMGLKIHQIRRHGGVDGYKIARPHGTQQTPCSQCGKHVQAQHMQRHILAVHLKIKAHSCDICGESFSRKDHLHLHQQRRHGGVDVSKIA